MDAASSERPTPIGRGDAAILLVAAGGVLAAAVAVAGGIDQSGQPITLIFRDGNYAEIGVGRVMPSIEGTDLAGTDSGNVYDDVTSFGGGVKVDLRGPWSAAVIVDQPYGVVVDYPSDTGFPYAGTHAEPNSLGVTALVRYELDGGFSLHGGLRAERFGAEAGLAGPGFGMLSGYEWTGDDDWGLGYVLGAAYEIPAIALRVALTYGSEIEHELEAEENFFGASTTDVTSPQSVNLDFQTGVAPKTLLFGSVRWVNWAGWSVPVSVSPSWRLA
jgi:long-subunit fatty acid transport protein